jgi:drug/metabolite transporter (DMT)-like permease
MTFSPRVQAIIEASLVTLIWSFSWVLIKFGLEDMPPLTFAGLRYLLAFLCLLVICWRSPSLRTEFHALGRKNLSRLALLGVFMYTLAQGSQFVALMYLPAVTMSLLLNFIPLGVLILGVYWLKEYPSRIQYIGMGVFFVGVLLYFSPLAQLDLPLFGVLIGLFCVLTNSAGSILTREINQDSSIRPILVTTVSMGIGSIALLIAGVLTEPFPTFTPKSALIVVWLAVVHTAFTFTLWNRALRTLQAVEASVINNMMLVYIAVLAWLFLGETLDTKSIVALGIALCGILIVQVMPHGIRLKGRFKASKEG